MDRGFSTLVFDLDGTLSDPSVGITRCLNHALREHGLATFPDSVLAAEIGPPLDETFLKLIPASAAGNLDSLVAKYRERYAAIGFSENEIYPGISEALTTLASSGLRLGICTSKLTSYAEKILTLFGVLECFDFVDGGDIGIKKIQQLSSLLDRGVIDRDAVMIGDRSVDIEAAHGNGLRSIGVLWGFGARGEVASARPTYIAGDVDELLARLEQ
jgi:phosphoglycolate phosphatase